MLRRRGDSSGAPQTSPRRITTSITAFNVRASGDRTGVHHTTGASWFSLLDERGKKMGGDLALTMGELGAVESAPAAGGLATSSAVADTRVMQWLLSSSDRTRFVVWSSNDTIVREVISCDP